jgi:hypothetical protein
MNAAAASPMALLRLIARPASLLLLFPLFLAAAWPFLEMLDSRADPFGSILRGDSSPQLRTAVWQYSILSGAAVGLFAALHRLEVQHWITAWSLPRLREGLLLGQAAVGATAGLVAAAVTSRVASPAEATAAGSACFVAVAMTGVILDVASPSPVRWLAAATLLAAALRPEMLASLAEQSPLILAAGAIALSLAAMVSLFGVDSARIRPFRFSGALGTQSRLALVDLWTRGGSDRGWSTELVTAGIPGWLRAAAHESFGGLKRGYLGDRLLAAFIIAVMASILQESGMLAFVGVILATRGIQLRRSLHRPVSRAQRATIAYLGTLADAVITFVFAALLFVPVSSLVLSVIPGLAEPARNPWPVVLAFAFAWSPLAQWAVARGQSLVATNSVPFRRMFQRYGLFMLFMVAVGGSGALLRRSALDVSASLMVAGAIGMLMQALHWAALRRFYGRADLHGP